MDKPEFSLLTPDYYAPGLHRVDMKLELTDNLRRMLANA
jgi:hypothetical protein